MTPRKSVCFGWKGVRPGVRPQEPDGESREEPEEHKRIKKGRPHGHRYGKKPGDREYFTADQLKKRCKKKYFH